LISCLRL